MTEQLLGPLAALALALVGLGLFQRRLILPKGVVLREDYDKLMEVNASYAAALPILTQAVNEALALAREERQRNGRS